MLSVCAAKIVQRRGMAKSGAVPGSVMARVFVVEAVSDTEHQEVGHVEIAQRVADVEERAARDADLQGEDLVEGFQVSALVEDVGAQSEPDGEVGHDELGASREADSQLPVDRRADKLHFGADDVVGDIDVGASVIDAVERYSCTELVSEVVEHRDIEPHDGVGVG